MHSSTNDDLAVLLQTLEQTGRGASLPLLEREVQAHPADPRRMLLLAAELVHAKLLDRAEAAFIATLNLAPAWPIPRFQLGLLQLTSGRLATALATWAPLEGLPDGHPLRLFKVGLEALARDEFDHARAALAEGISRNSEIPPLNRDMQQVLDGIAELAARAAAQAAAVPEPAGDHFLVSTYRNAR